jgi:serine/threonine-protein kinase
MHKPLIGEMVPVTGFGFYIDAFEVTNREFAEFLNARGNREESGSRWFELGDEEALIERRSGGFTARAGFEDHPVVEITWFGAQRYCQWKGKRLPSFSEWEQAALGADGRRYPWGQDGPGSGAGHRANYYQDFPEDGYEKTAPVGSYPQGVSPYGAHDMVGNVWEWVDGSGDERAILGGSFESGEESLGTPFEADPSLPMGETGFRCAQGE